MVELPMEIEYELTIADMEAFMRFHKKHGPKLKPQPLAKTLLLGFGAMVVILLLLPSWFSGNPMSEWVTGFCNGTIAGIAITIAFLFLLAKLGNANILRFYEREECRWLFDRRRLKIRAECFEITNRLQQLRYDWSVVWLIDS